MSDGAVIAVIVVVVIVVLAVLAFVFLRGRARRQRLQDRFGPEYGRTVESAESRRAAEQELTQREKRHEELDIRPLQPQIREEYARQWADVQEQFVDTPVEAVAEADRLVTIVMAERGYPTEGYEERLSYLSVEHAGTLDHYRAAREVTGRSGGQEASTEDLRQAMVHYRALFTDLLRSPDDAEPPRTGTAGPTPTRTDSDDAVETSRSQRAARRSES